MARMEYAEGFADDLAGVWSAPVAAHVERVLAMLEAFPLSGSPDVPDSVAREFGPQVRKCVVSPFDLACEYDEGEDVVFVHGLVDQRGAW